MTDTELPTPRATITHLTSIRNELQALTQGHVHGRDLTNYDRPIQPTDREYLDPQHLDDRWDTTGGSHLYADGIIQALGIEAEATLASLAKVLNALAETHEPYRTETPDIEGDAWDR